MSQKTKMLAGNATNCGRRTSVNTGSVIPGHAVWDGGACHGLATVGETMRGRRADWVIAKKSIGSGINSVRVRIIGKIGVGSIRIGITCKRLVRGCRGTRVNISVSSTFLCSMNAIFTGNYFAYKQTYQRKIKHLCGNEAHQNVTKNGVFAKQDANTNNENRTCKLSPCNISSIFVILFWCGLINLLEDRRVFKRRFLQPFNFKQIDVVQESGNKANKDRNYRRPQYGNQYYSSKANQPTSCSEQEKAFRLKEEIFIPVHPYTLVLCLFNCSAEMRLIK